MKKTHHLTVQKDSPDARFGFQLTQEPGLSPIVIESVEPNGIFSKTALETGMELIEINLRGLGGKSALDAIKMLKEAPVGEIMIVTRGQAPSVSTKITMRTYQVSVKKENPEARLGLVLAQRPGSAQIIIKDISSDGPFAKTELVPGLQVMEINLQGLAGKTVHHAIQMLRQASGDILIVARGQIASVYKTARETKVGVTIQEKRLKDGPRDFVIQKLSDDGLLAKSGLQPGQRVSALNGSLCPSNTNNIIQVIQDTVGHLMIVALESEAVKAEEEQPPPRKHAGEEVALTVDGSKTMETKKESEAAKAEEEQPREQAPPRKDAGEEVALIVDGSKTMERKKASAFVAVPRRQENTSFKEIQVTRTNGKGLSLGLTQNYVYIHRIAPTSPFADSELKAGQRIIKINGEQCSLSLKGAMAMIADNGFLTTIDALEQVAEADEWVLVQEAASVNPSKEQFKPITATITKKTVDEPMGITLGMTEKHVFVNSIAPESPFAKSEVCVGHRIVKIDGDTCPASLKATMTLISQHVGTLTIDALEKVVSDGQVSASIVKTMKNSPVGIDVAVSIQGRLAISDIDPDGPLATSPLHVGQIISSVNGGPCQDKASVMRCLASATGKVTIVASNTVAVFEKSDIDIITGISLVKSGDDGTIAVHKIEIGVFANSNLLVGQKVLSISGVACPANAKEALGLIQDSVGTCKIVAVDTFKTQVIGEPEYDDGRVTASVTKESMNSIVGISLGKKQDSIIVHNIAQASLFASTNLNVGQQVISINGKACTGSLKESMQVIKDCVGTLTLVAVGN
jgi:C-terminal processing protease CtpA/Prc